MDEEIPGTETADADYDTDYDTDFGTGHEVQPVPSEFDVREDLPTGGEEDLVEHLGDAPLPKAPPADVESPLPADRFADRELSWLDFNERVLDLAADPSIPLLERARFLAIFASNLDEFFMVRVAGVKQLMAAGVEDVAPSGLTPRRRLSAISDRAHQLVTAHGRLFGEVVAPQLAGNGIRLMRWADLSDDVRGPLGTWFDEQVFPVLTPLAVDPAHPFPYISGLSLNLAVTLVNPATGAEHFARLKVPQTLPRLLRVDGGRRDDPDTPVDLVPLEDVIGAHLDRLFPGMDVVSHHMFRVTRNEDLSVADEESGSLLTALEKELLRRRFGPAVRLEVAADIDERSAELLERELGVTPEEVYRVPEPLDLRACNIIADLDRPELRFPPFRPRTHPTLADAAVEDDPATLFRLLQEQDVLVHHPYDSFVSSVQAFVAAAAADPDVLAIKQTLYRTSSDSEIVRSLIAAANAGKQVLAIVEIKARFDEAANISQARQLEQAGVHVVYGLVGLKTHAKLSLAVRREPGGVRRYCHVGTGNYHPRTARLYEDLGLLTCDPQVGEDLTVLFNQLSGFAPRSRYRRLLVAPRTARTGLLELIEREVGNAEAGKRAGIRLKVNSLVDETVIDALYLASRAGVPVSAVVRGACALRPGVPGLSETIRVVSVLGRFLEHSRVFWFAGAGNPTVLIGSADVMPRNLDRRIEALVRLSDPRHVSYLGDLLATAASEDTASWRLGPGGDWVRVAADEAGRPLPHLQDLLMTAARSRSRAPTLELPHRHARTA